MGFSSPDKTGTSSGAHGTDITGEGATKPSFGSSLMSAFQKEYPLAGAVANGVMNFGPSPQNEAQKINMQPQEQQPLPDFLAMNAKPKEGGGLMTLLKLIGG